MLPGGFGSGVWEALSEGGVVPRVLRVGLPDRYVTHGAPEAPAPGGRLHRRGDRRAHRVRGAGPARLAGRRLARASSVPAPMPRVRLDSLLAERGLFESRSRAAAAVLAGDVRVADRPRAQGRAARRSRRGDHRRPRAPPYVSRGGVKLANALDAFGVDVAGRRCLDVGASTGGFTDCLLQRGAAHVIALDVAYGELDYRLRRIARVTVMERVNARAVSIAALRAVADRVRRVVHLAAQGAAGRAGAAPRRSSTAWRWSSRSSRSAGGRWARAAWCAIRRCGASAVVGVASSRRGVLGDGLRLLGAAGAGGQPGDVRVARRGRARRARCRRFEAAAEEAGADQDRHRHDAPTRARDDQRGPRPGGRRAARRRDAALQRRRGGEALAAGRRGDRGPRGLARRRPLHRARRRRDDPHRAAPLRRHRRPGVRRQLRRGRLPRHASTRTGWRATSTRAFAGEYETLELPTITVGRPEGPVDGR